MEKVTNKNMELEDADLLALAIKKTENADLSKAIPHEEMMRMFGITQADLDQMEVVEIE